jgi:glutaredoxin-like protein
MLQEGQRVPEVTVYTLENGRPRPLRTSEIFGRRTVVAIGLPGAFTPTCSSQQLPRYDELAPKFRELGVEAIVCLSVNDPFVMAQWGVDQDLHEVRLLADGNGEFARAMGMLLDKSRLGMGQRSRRYSMLVRDGVIERLFAEADRDGDPFEVSGADRMLAELGGEPMPHLALITKPGCPFCAEARRLLDDRGLRYTEVPLTDAVRGRALAAIAGETTAPQVFVDGERIGGLDALRRHLATAQSRRA